MIGLASLPRDVALSAANVTMETTVESDRVVLPTHQTVICEKRGATRRLMQAHFARPRANERDVQSAFFPSFGVRTHVLIRVDSVNHKGCCGRPWMKPKRQ